MRRLVSALVGVGLLGLGLTGCGSSSDQGARAAGQVPKDALGFFSLAIEPSADQKANLAELLLRFPDLNKKVSGESYEDIKESFVKAMSEDSDVKIDYEKDIKPWLGEEAAIALMPPTPDAKKEAKANSEQALGVRPVALQAQEQPVEGDTDGDGIVDDFDGDGVNDLEQFDDELNEPVNPDDTFPDDTFPDDTLPDDEFDQEFDQDFDEFDDDFSEEAGLEPVVVGLVATKDIDAAKKFITKMTKNSDGNDPGNYELAFLYEDDYVLITEASSVCPSCSEKEALTKAEKYLKNFAAAEDTLDEAKNFTDATGEVKGDSLVLGWVDATALVAELTPESPDKAKSVKIADCVGKAVGTTDGTFAFGMHVTDDAFVVEGAAKGSSKLERGKSDLAQSAPDDVIASISVFDLGGIGQSLLDCTNEPEIEAALDQISQGFDIDIEKDILGLMHGETSVVIGPIEDFAPQGALLIEPTAGNAPETVEKIAGALEMVTGAPLEESKIDGATAYTYVDVDDALGSDFCLVALKGRVVVATSLEYAEQLAKPAAKSFGETESYKGAVSTEKADETQFELVVRLEPIYEIITGLGGEETDPNAELLDTLALRAWQDGDVNRFEGRLTIKDGDKRSNKDEDKS